MIRRATIQSPKNSNAVTVCADEPQLDKALFIVAFRTKYPQLYIWKPSIEPLRSLVGTAYGAVQKGPGVPEKAEQIYSNAVQRTDFDSKDVFNR